jgi:hypothetical protein
MVHLDDTSKTERNVAKQTEMKDNPRMAQEQEEAGSKDILASFPLMALVAANLVPLIGVIAFGWDLGTLMLLYWLESAIIGFYNILKLAIVAKRGAFFLAPFFAVHYGLFMLVHLVFICVLFLRDRVGPGDMFPDSRIISDYVKSTALAAASLFVSHGISFCVNFVGQKEYIQTDPGTQMVSPYGRIIVMHLTILFGGFVTFLLGAPIAVLVLFVILKTVADMAAHRREHLRLALKKIAGAPGQCE